MKAFLKKKGESGMMVVETVISLTVFIVVVAGVIYFMNIFILHNKVQFAIDSAAHELASYSYFYEALGIRSLDSTLGEDWAGDAEQADESYLSVLNAYETLTTTFDDTKTAYGDLSNFDFSSLSGMYSSFNTSVEDIQTVEGDIEKSKEAVTASKEKLEVYFKNPKLILAGMIGLGLSSARDEVKCLAGQYAAEALTEKYLETDERSADDYLLSCGVTDGYEGLDFSKSSLFGESDTNGKMIDIVVEYDVHIGFLGLIMEDPTVHVLQRVCIPGWLGGDDRYVEDFITVE